MKKVKSFLELIKFEHTAFALPFAYLGMILPLRAWPGFGKFFWVTLAMVAARTAAMTLNRLIDLKIDALNPRTKARPSVTGEIPAAVSWAAVAASVLIFFLSAFMLNRLCFQLSFLALFLFSGYHFVKRFSFLSHFALGLVLAIAPMGGWIAVTGAFSWMPVPLAFAVLFWVAGFDILYSLLDVDFDRAHGLHSVPVRFGATHAVRVARVCHALTVFFLIVFGWVAGLGIIYVAGTLLVAGLLAFEHWLVKDGDLSRIPTAFFNVNGWIGILLFVFTFMEMFR
ncbi:MAG: UbiA family prenyltransferase [Candidatus Omnitrophica bacterium]|nr:UbiA family prenyltransferase [Candidatus Omnitrophota bacterium]